MDGQFGILIFHLSSFFCEQNYDCLMHFVLSSISFLSRSNIINIWLIYFLFFCQLFIWSNNRFPSMESSMEARTGNKIDTYFHSSRPYTIYSNSGNHFTARQNGSLPRKFNSSIPIRNEYYGYTHGKAKKNVIIISWHINSGRNKLNGNTLIVALAR